MHHSIRTLIAGLAPVMALTLATGTVATAKPVAVEYSIKYIGFSIGNAILTGDISPEKYHLDGRVTLSGVARRMAGDGGSLRSIGVVTRSSLRPKSFSWRFDGYKGLSQVAVLYADGNVRKVTAKLAPGTKKDRVEVLPEHHLDVIDPLTGFAMLDNGNPESVCSGSRALFNGVSRFNVSLQYLGVDNGAIMCSFAYHPVAGHPRDVDVEAAAQRKNNVWFKRIGSVYLPVKIIMEAKVGSVTIEAKNM